MDQNKTPHCTRFPPWGKHKYHVTDAAHISKGPQITQRCPRSRDTQRLEEIVYGVDLRFPWFTSHSREDTFSKYRWVLLSAGSSSLPSFALWCQHVFLRFGLYTPRSLRIREFGGGTGAHLDVELPGEGQSPSKTVAGGSLLLGYPWSTAVAGNFAGSARSPPESMLSPPVRAVRRLRRQPGKCSLSSTRQANARSEDIRHQI